jgi:hypothetical protein
LGGGYLFAAGWTPLNPPRPIHSDDNDRQSLPQDFVNIDSPVYHIVDINKMVGGVVVNVLFVDYL